MGISFRQVALPTACAVVTLLAACGGGGGGGGSTTATVTLTPAAQINLGLADTFGATQLTGIEGTGLWNNGGGGSDSGSADAGGSAGDGEFVKVNVKFPVASPTGTLTWTILRSAYGLEGRSGQLTLQPDGNGNGGYKVVGTGVSANQSNIFVSKSGQISGSLPLPINTGPDSVFLATRFNDSTAISLATYAGTYNYVSVSATKGTGGNGRLGYGLIKLATDGKGRICPNQGGAMSYSDTCLDGLNIVGSFDSTANNVLRFVQSPTQDSNATTNASQLDLIAVAKSFSSPANGFGVSVSGDFISYNKVDGFRTGALYASRQGNADGSILSTFSPTNLLDSNGGPTYWNLTVKETSNGTGKTVYAMFKDVGGGVVKRSFYDATQSPACNQTSLSGFIPYPGGVPGAIQSNTSGSSKLGIAQADADSIALAADTGMAIGRRTTAANVLSLMANCPPLP